MRVRSSWIAANLAALFGAAAAVSAGDVDRTIGTLPPGKTITLKFRVTTTGTPTSVSNQATVNGTNFASVLTDDPKVGGATDTTTTSVQLNSTVGVTANVNPAAFGQSVTLTAAVSGPGVTPTGTVQFKDGGVDIGAAQTLNGSGQATLTATYAVGSHTITAAYAGDTNYNAASGSLTGNPLAVGLSNTTTTVTGPGAATVTGQVATFTATVAAVAPGTGTPTGTVRFTEGGTTHCASVAVNGSGQATCAIITFTTATAHTITGTYLGNASYNASNVNATAHTVNKAATSTAVSSSSNPSAFGQTVTVTASVAANAPGAGTPTGTVVFTIDSVAQAPSALTSGSASMSTAALSVGGHTVTVAYAGDANFATSNGTLSSGQTVNKSTTSTSLVSSLNPSAFGQLITLTATVAAVAPGVGTPTGTVTFKDGGTTLGSGTLNGSGVATFSTAALAAGSHTLTAEYGGDVSYSAGSGSLSGNPLVVNKATTTTGVVSSVNPSVFGQAATFTATVAVVAPGAGTPTGTVTFFDGATTLGTGTLNGSLQATFATSSLAAGARSITAAYSGDSSFATSTASVVSQTVNRATTTTSLQSSVNPSVFGQMVTITATVAAVAPGAGTPTGVVTFRDGGTSIGTGTLSGGLASLTTSTLAASTHSVTADYGGDASFAASSASANSQVVNKASTSSSLFSSVNPSTFGQSVTIAAMVVAVGPGAGIPSGTVTFRDGGTALGAPVALSSGQASLTTTALAVGVHSLTADYNGDASFSGSSAPALSQTVNKATPGLSLASSLNPSTQGTSVTFTATLISNGGTPTGAVTFQNGGAALGTVALVSGTATLSTSSLAFGSHSITASYAGDGNNATSSASLIQIVNSPDSLVNISARAKVQTGDDVAIAGFIISGNSPKKVLITARGPSLALPPFNVPGTLNDPLLQLFSGATQIDSNDNFQERPNWREIPATLALQDTRESAILTTLSPGAYTAIMTGVGQTSGVAIVEVFEVDLPEVQLINLSTRARVETYDDVMIAGFIIQGNVPRTLVVTARGPSLAVAPFNVPNTLADPYIRVFSGPTLVYENDNWMDWPTASQIPEGQKPKDPKDAGLRVTLPPGAYTVVVSGGAAGTGVGVAIVEIFVQ